MWRNNVKILRIFRHCSKFQSDIVVAFPNVNAKLSKLSKSQFQIGTCSINDDTLEVLEPLSR